tara:strand:- start:12618 stop:13253 length:636 start_codon:yes stop_codon:yes gene_type:complete
MFTTIALLVGFFLVLLLIKMKNNKPKVRTRINFKTAKGKNYTGVLRQGTSGRTRTDWDFYDDEDDLILNLIILDYLFDVIDFDDEWDETDYAIEDGFIEANDVHVAEQVVFTEMMEEEEAVIEEVVFEPEIAVEPTYIPEPVAEPVYVPEAVVETVYTPEPVAEVADVYETEVKSTSYDSGSYDSGSYDSGSYDSGSYDSGSSDSGGGSDD